MPAHPALRRFSRIALAVLCTLGLLSTSLPAAGYSSIDEHPGQPGRLRVAQEPTRTRSNHNTQIAAPGPSGVRVSTWSGDLFYPLSLLTIPGRGLPLNITLSYNSSWHDYGQHYGYGWQLSYNMFYVRHDNGDITVVWENGRSDRFVKSNGAFLSPVDTYDTLAEYLPGKYVLRSKYGLAYYFESSVHKRLTRLADPNGNALTFAYNADVLLTTITDTGGRQVQLAYTGGLLTAITDANAVPSRAVQFQYDAAGNLSAVTDLGGEVTHYGYDAAHYLTEITPPLGVSTVITYMNGAVTMLTGELTARSFAYDPASRVTTMTDLAPEGNSVTRFYSDVLGRIQMVEDPMAHRKMMTWDVNNNLLTLTDALNRTTAYTYDGMGNLVSVTDPLNHTTLYTYETAHNRLTGVTNANGHTTTYAYDEHGNLLAETDPLGHVTSYLYDAQGNLINRTDANGHATTSQYNAYGQPVTVTASSGEVVTYTYDPVGNVTGMANAEVSVAYGYDVLNRVKSANVLSYGKAIHYNYNPIGDRSSMADPDGTLTNYLYDSAGRLVSLTNPAGQTTTFAYDALGRLSRKNYANGAYALYAYDPAGRSVSLVNKKSTGEIISGYSYEYDAAGNRTEMTEAGGGVTTYVYDALSQLVRVDYPDGTFQAYTYDPAGNRLAMTDTTGTTHYVYDAADRLLSVGPVSYGWADNGNLITRTEGSSVTTYDYDFENRLASIAFSDGSTNGFAYYPNGKRLSTIARSGAESFYFYDGLNLLAETNDGGPTTARYTSAGLDGWLSEDRGSSSYYYLSDALRSVTGLTDAGQAMAASVRYDAFGQIKARTGAVVPAFGFTGREYDQESGLYFFRARYYDPAAGRFISADPIGLAGGTNLYVYVQNNPINVIDPLGLMGRTPPTPTPYPTPVPPDFNFPLPTPVRTPDWPWMPTPTPCGGCSSPPPPGGGRSGGGGGGGWESKPLKIAPSAFLGQDDPKDRTVPAEQPAALVDLRTVLPMQGPAGTVATPVTPTVQIGGATNAVDAAAVNFVADSDQAVKAVVFATKTITRTYEHDYPVCNRFQGYTLESAAPIAMSGVLPGSPAAPWFWYASMTKGSLVEEAFTFVAFVDEDNKTFTIDSRWLADDYPRPEPPPYDYVFNFQVWGSSAEDAYGLLRHTLANLAALPGWTVSFASTAEPTPPALLFKSAACWWPAACGSPCKAGWTHPGTSNSPGASAYRATATLTFRSRTLAPSCPDSIPWICR